MGSVLAVVLGLGDGLSPRPKAICVRGTLPRRWLCCVPERRFSFECDEPGGGSRWLPPKLLIENDAGSNEKRRDCLFSLREGASLFFRLKLNEGRREDSVDRLWSPSLGMDPDMLTGGSDFCFWPWS